jgi:hypothetical protein
MMNEVINGLIKGAEFSECRKYRYALWRIWRDDRPIVMIIGLNPSTANEADDDTTISNLRTMLTSLGYGGFYMMNLFALISSNPDNLRSCPDPVKDNDLWLTEISKRCKEIFFAWGSFKQAEYRIKKVEVAFPNAKCFGKTAKGKPLHPLAATLWMKKSFEIQPYKPTKN